jgi:hypothetical protein
MCNFTSFLDRNVGYFTFALNATFILISVALALMLLALLTSLIHGLRCLVGVMNTNNLGTHGEFFRLLSAESELAGICCCFQPVI